MKLTTRMRKVLLYLQNPYETLQWFNEKFGLNVIGFGNYYEDIFIMSFCEKKSFWDFQHSERVSFRRTFKILEKLGLIEKIHELRTFSKLPPYIADYRLTNKGKEVAEQIEKEIGNLIKEYEYLV